MGDAVDVSIEFNLNSVTWQDIEAVYLNYKEAYYKVELQPDNKFTLPALTTYPPYFNILNTDLEPLFATI